jgi:hypothetical protein
VNSSMLIQWLTFAVMILIQAVAAGVIISAIRVQLTTHGEEIKSLRDWRHDFAPKSMIIDDHGKQLVDHEERLRYVEKHPLSVVGPTHTVVADCPITDCPYRAFQHEIQAEKK